jgi:hypothetical protein
LYKNPPTAPNLPAAHKGHWRSGRSQDEDHLDKTILFLSENLLGVFIKKVKFKF